MIKINFVPTAFLMADPAVCFRVIFSRDNILVDIFMTIIAFQSNFPEIPYYLFFMTIGTWCGKMCSLKAKIPLVVLVNSIGKLIKSCNIMTL